MPKIKRTKELSEEIKESILSPIKKPALVRFDKVISTGSTLLDLAISGTKVNGGGIPGGIVVEIFGPPGSGKTCILAEILGNAQRKGGDIHIDDPEARLDKEYAEIYGVELNKEKNYARPDTVTEMFKGIIEWEPKPEIEDALCIRGEDSLAALSTNMEMEGEDKRGQRRAKEFSEGLRKTCRIIANKNWLIVCTNQIRTGDSGNNTTPGGFGIPFYSSLRIQINQAFPKWRLTKTESVGSKKDLEKVIGVRSTCKITKSTVDAPFRECDIYIVFNYGIHDIWGNLQWQKDMTGATRYMAVDKEFQSVEKAIKHIEENNLEIQLRENIINLWEEIENKFNIERKPKVRW